MMRALACLLGGLVAAQLLLLLAASPAPTEAAQEATRLVHGPAVFRIDQTGGNPDDFRSEYRYLVVFKLNQDPTARLNNADFRRGIEGPRGNYSIAGFDLSTPEGDPDSFRDVPNCFFSFVDVPWRPLDRVKLGRRVETRLRPLTPSPDGEATLGRLYVVRSTLRFADRRLSRPAARAALHRIGCLRR